MDFKLRTLLLNSIFALRSSFVTNMTDEQELVRLVESLHPLATQQPLIRLGVDGDGGYLIPDDLNDIQACFSPGVGRSSDFEVACADLGMDVYLADHSVDGPAKNHDRFHFIKQKISAFPEEDSLTLNEWVNSSVFNNTSDLMLQMDIEGGEYEVLHSASSELVKRFRIIVVEFHDLHKLWNLEFFSRAKSAFNKLLTNHRCVHIHPNNYGKTLYHRGICIPTVMEFTFLRQDRIGKSSFASSFPHPLDVYNARFFPGISLPTNWYKHGNDSGD